MKVAIMYRCIIPSKTNFVNIIRGYVMEQTMQNQELAPAKKKMTKAKRQEYLFVASLLAVPILFFLVFWVYVNFDSLILSFQHEVSEGIGEDKVVAIKFTFENYTRVFTEFFQKGGQLGIALRNTLLFFTVNLVVVLPLSLLMAYFIYKKIAGYKIFRTITYLPNIICSSALVALFKFSFEMGGPYDAILKAIGGEEFLFKYCDPLAGERAIYLLVAYNIIFGFGGNLVIFGGAMNSISADVLEAGEIDGCNWFQELIYLIIPMMWPTISTLLLLSFSSILSATGPILAMTNGKYGTSTLSFLLYGYATGAVKGEGAIYQDIYYASAIGMVMTLITFPLVLLLRKVIFKEEKA